MESGSPASSSETPSSAPAVPQSGSQPQLPPPPASPRQVQAPPATYSDEVKAALAELAAQGGTGPISPLLMRVVPDIAHTGLTCYDWSLLRGLILHLLDLKMTEFNQQFPDYQAHFDSYRQRILGGLANFPGHELSACHWRQGYPVLTRISVPFTVQRICELIVRPEKYYKSTKKLVFALEKMVLVSSTQETMQPQEYNQAVAQQQMAIQNLPKGQGNPIPRYPLEDRYSTGHQGSSASDIFRVSFYCASSGLTSLPMNVETNSIGGPVATVMPRLASSPSPSSTATSPDAPQSGAPATATPGAENAHPASASEGHSESPHQPQPPGPSAPITEPAGGPSAMEVDSH